MSTITLKAKNGYELQVSCGNRKMIKGFGIFNLTEKATCIGSTEFCRKCCYAEKASRIYKSVSARRAKNTEASRQADFVEVMIKIISKLEKSKNFTGFFRLHESGDFYNQEYVNKWIEIIKVFPNIKFLAFTKSFNLNYSEMPTNMQIVYSVMPDTIKATIPSEGMKAYAGEQEIPKNTLECPGLCDTCGACWDLSKTGYNVHFAIH